MQFTAEYAWLESHLDNDSLWLDDVVSWDDIFDLATTDYNIFSFLTSPFFLNTHLFLDYLTKLSFLDILFLNETKQDLESKEFFELVMWDVSLFFIFLFFKGSWRKA